VSPTGSIAACAAPRADRTARRRAGFTLVEVLAVLVVIGLIATIVTVNWQGLFPRSQLNSSVRALAATLQSTRSDAIARSAEFQVQYDLENNRYRVVTPFRFGGGLAADDEERMALEWTALPETVRFAHVTIDGVDYDSGVVFVRFDPLGTANAHTIVLYQQAFDNYYTIEVQALTGLIDFYEGLHARPEAVESDFE
jgi:type II secretion system protein H